MENQKIRNILEDYSDLDLTRLCQDHFHDVKRKFTDGMTKTKKVQLLIEYVEQHGQRDALVRQIQQERPHLFKNPEWEWFRPRLLKAAVRLSPTVGEKESLIEQSIDTNHSLVKNQVSSCPDRLQDKDILYIFNQCKTMLILGAPGSGKTMRLHQLASNLASTGGENEGRQKPLPIYIPLSEWKKQSLYEHIKKCLSSPLYGVPKKTAENMTAKRKNNFIDTILLLDGLDEVPPDQQTACVKAINDFRKAEGPAGLVVTCREEAYKKLLDQGIKLELQAAIILQPLDWEQIKTHLQTRKQYHLLSRFVEDSSLRELANNPLMFRVIREAFPESSGDARDNGLAGATLEERRKEVFTIYICRILEDCSSSFPREHLLSGIRMLASGMAQKHLSVFRLDQIALSWLPSEMQPFYRSFSGLAANVMKFLIGLLIGVFAWFVLALFPTPDAWSSGVKAFITGVPFIASITVLFIGLHRIANIGNVDFASTAPTNGSQQHRILQVSNFGGWPHFLLGSVAGFSGLLPGLIAPDTSIFYGVAVVVGAGLVWPALLFLHTKVSPPSSEAQPDDSSWVEPTLANTEIRVLLVILPFASITIMLLAFNGWLISPEFGIQSLFCLLALSIVLLIALLKELEPWLNHRLLLALAASFANKGKDHNPSPTMLFSLLLPGSKQVRRYNDVLRTLCKCKFLQPSTKVADQGEAYEFQHLLFREYFASLEDDDDDIKKIVSCIQKHQRS